MNLARLGLFYAFAALMCASAIGQNNFNVIYNFMNYPNDGAFPTGDVVFDARGNMYGTTAAGGSSEGCIEGCGAVFELSPNQDGTWSESVIYSFCSVGGCADGNVPIGALVLDSHGNLYGTTYNGGISRCIDGCGIAYKLSPPSQQGKPWKESVLYRFCNIQQGDECLDGENPSSALIFDSAGNLYGTANGGNGDISGGGIVFELTPGEPNWTETVLYDFCSQGASCPDGYNPSGSVIFDPVGNLYGMTTNSGNQSAPGGTVYELVHSANGWSYKSILEIPSTATSGSLSGAPTFDALGNLCGTFTVPKGGVFRINPTTGKLGVFSFNGTDGATPNGIFVNPTTNIGYGTTEIGGISNDGVAFAITENGKETELHSFCSLSNCEDGQYPESRLIPNAAGNLYGTAHFG